MRKQIVLSSLVLPALLALGCQQRQSEPPEERARAAETTAPSEHPQAEAIEQQAEEMRETRPDQAEVLEQQADLVEEIHDEPQTGAVRQQAADVNEAAGQLHQGSPQSSDAATEPTTPSPVAPQFEGEQPETGHAQETGRDMQR